MDTYEFCNITLIPAHLRFPILAPMNRAERRAEEKRMRRLEPINVRGFIPNTEPKH